MDPLDMRFGPRAGDRVVHRERVADRLRQREIRDQRAKTEQRVDDRRGDVRFAAVGESNGEDAGKSQEYEGYTGNAGNTLDRWYHRSAIVLWRRDQHFEVVARSGAEESIALF